ncbi:MAG: prohibitin family protein [Ignavibacteria bacterium]|nr:prohibitin family protein [Ignavibacteria bacterium]
MFLAFFLFLIGIGVLFAFRKAAQKPPAMKFVPSFFIGLALLVAVYNTVVIIPAGYAGVQVLFGSVLDASLQNGMHVVNPFVEIVEMDVRTQAYTMSGKANEGQMQGDDAIEVLSGDGLTLRLELTVQYRLSASDASKVYRSIGTDYVEKVVRPEIRSAIRDAAVGYLATDLYASRRDEFIQHVRGRLEKVFRERGIVLEAALLRNIELPARVREAINDKIAAEQESQKMVYILQKERQEADRKRVEAAGISDAQKIISSSLTNQYLQYNYIQALKELTQSKNSTFVIAPMDQKLVPMINVK